MKSKNPIMKKVTVFLLCAALSAAAVLLLSCAPLLESSAPVPAGTSAETGRVVLTVSAGAAGPARTILPTEEPVFSRYKLVFSRNDYTDIVINNATGLAGSGVSQELAAGTWTATVTAYQNFTISGVEDEYPAAGGSADITVNAGQSTNKTVNLAPLPVEATEPGIFTYTVNFPADATAELIFGSEAPVSLTVSGTEVSMAAASGYYDLFISAEKGALRAGLSEKVHIYAGLESKGVFTFTDTDFTATVYLTGTVSLPGALTWDDMDSEAVNVVNVYSNAARTDQIGTVPLTGLSWVTGIPASNIGSIVYLGAALTGMDGKIYTGTGDTGGSVVETGVRNITLADTTSPANVSSLSGTPGDGQVTLAWTDPADADLDHVEITWTPADGMSQPISVNKGTQTKTITGLTAGTTYTFTVKAVDTAGNESGDKTATATPFVPVSGITDLPATGTAGVSLPLSGTVEPSNATHQTIVWFVKQGAETTAADAEITNGVLSTTGAGIVKVAATITDGTAVGTSYIQEFSITINSLSAGQLAADLNAISPGSASASGQTVTLMADLTLTGTITVPSGVTLDLVSSHKSLALGNNAVLTVNGTVNAEASTPNGTSFISGNGKLLVDSSTGNPATIDGTGVIHLKSQGTILYIESGKGLTLSGVTLDGLMTTAAAAAAGITLPPGYEDDSNNNERLVMFDGTLTMQSGVIGYNAGGGVIFGGVFNMYGGEIKNNYIFEGSYPQGGGIYVGSGSVFTMYGGEIKGNKAGSQGGGVYVTAGDYGNGKFVMAGGTVYGSSAGSGLANTSGSSGASLYCPFANAYWGDGATSIPDKSNQNGTLHGGTPTGTVE